jgi:TldD protein
MMKKNLYADIYFEKARFFRLVLEPDRVDEIASGEDEGLSLRTIEEDFKNNLQYTTKHFEEFLKEQAKTFFKKEHLSSFEHLRKGLAQASPEEELPIDRAFSFLEELKKKIPKDPEIRHYRLLLSILNKKILILNSDGEPRQNERKYFRAAILVVVEKDGRLERGYEVLGYSLPMEEALLRDPRFFELSERAVRLAKLMLSARKAPAGRMPVILSGEAGGTMIHEAVGHGLEADHAEEGLSIYSGRLGEKVASPLITVIDDPTLSNLYGSYNIDDEGTPAERVILIEKGILKNFLYDRFTALKFHKKSNGHGRRETFRELPIPRMANTFIAPGRNSPEEVLKSIEKGLLVKKMGGGEVNPLTGDFVFEVREGYYIEKGEILYPVKGATLVGNGPQILEIIDMVANDLHFDPGTCGKDGQGVPVSDGQPTLRIPEITVSGVLE